MLPLIYWLSLNYVCTQVKITRQWKSILRRTLTVNPMLLLEKVLCWHLFFFSLSIVQYNETESGAPADWKQLIDINKQDGSDPCLALLEPNMVYLMVDHFTSFAVTGNSATSEPAKKIVKIVAYVSPPAQANGDCVVRVYCVGDLPVHLEVCFVVFFFVTFFFVDDCLVFFFVLHNGIFTAKSLVTERRLRIAWAL